ncbi:MAG: dipeptide epimerase [Methanobacteriota archaeon]|nr:MAG: dipeptide epimerase [Euryarchaeota archaeon]
MNLIDDLRFRSYSIRRRNVFRIATSASDVEDNIVVRVDAGDDFGVGNASPSDVTHETRETIERFLTASAGRIRGVAEDDLEALHDVLDSVAPGNTAAKAAIDIAVHDLLGKRCGVQIYEALGGRGDGRLVTDMTVGIEGVDETVRRAVANCRDGFRALKLKVGLDIEQDLLRVAAVREAVGSGVELRVDANQGYDVDEAIRFCEEMDTLGVALVEQPVDADDYAGLKAVRERSPVPIMADECLRTIADAERVAAEGAADIINIKLMKSGGIHPARTIDRIAKDASMTTMVGCMGEIQLSIAAGLHFALGSDNVRYVDLDSHFSMIDDPSSGLTFEDGLIGVSGRPGLGMTTDMDC